MNGLPDAPGLNRRLRWGTFAAGLLGGAIAWAAIEPYYPFYTLPNEQRSPTDREVFLAFYGNAAWVFATYGAVVTALIGFGTRWRSSRLAVTLLLSLFVGLPLGAAMGVAGGFFGQYCSSLLGNLAADYRIVRTVIIHAAGWSGTALSVAIVASMGTWRCLGRAAARTLAAGVLAALLYCPTVAVLLPLQDTDTLIPDARFPRLFWMLLASGLMGLLIKGPTGLARLSARDAGASPA